RFGLQRFIQQACLCGVDGVVIPDLPVEEAADLIKVAKKKKFATIFLLAPTSDLRRIKEVSAKSSGFIYYVSLTGTTGARVALPKELSAELRRIKRITAKPVCVGFGISTPEQAKKIARVADGVIVGSAIIKVIEKNLGRKDLTAKVTNFVRRLKQAI
ncbi:MAG: tryptophan synthase subunit alpha, partial [Candidatus Omnitrophica bacterium]|nr:tryptophan synthase subunit alpha [Candidatus Omnitrophota bacterium]